MVKWWGSDGEVMVSEVMSFFELSIESASFFSVFVGRWDGKTIPGNKNKPLNFVTITFFILDNILMLPNFSLEFSL